MKLLINRSARREQGSAVIVIMVLLGLMLLYVGANLKTLHFMSRELNVIERHQVRRLQTASKPVPADQQEKPAAPLNAGNNENNKP